jgi:type VI secretion system secreted protein VgrG
MAPDTSSQLPGYKNFGRRPNTMHKFKFLTIAIILILALVLAVPSLVAMARTLAAAIDPGLGTAANASILSATSLTNAGSSSTNRDVNDLINLSAPVGLTIGGDYHSAGGVAGQVQADASAADLNMLGQALTSNEGPVLDGLTLVSGVYDIGAGRLNGGVLTLNGPGVYIFRASSDFISSGSINFINGARACDLYWHVQSLATINGSSFAGTIIAGTGVHFGDSVTLDGRALAIGGDVTLINDTITGPSCAAAATSVPNVRATKTALAARGTAGVSGGSGVNGVSGVSGLPNTGGAPIRNDEFPLWMVIIASLTILVLALGIRGYRRTGQPKQ